MNSNKNLIFVYVCCEFILIILLFILNFHFKLPSSHIFVTILINLITIFPLPIFVSVNEYRNELKNVTETYINKLSIYREHLTVLKFMIERNFSFQEIEDYYNKNYKCSVMKIDYKEIKTFFSTKRESIINKKMCTLLIHSQGLFIEKHLKIVDKNDFKNFIIEELEYLDMELMSLKFININKKWQIIKYYNDELYKTLVEGSDVDD